MKKNKNKVRISLFKSITKIDVKNGQLTFGQRIELGEIFSGNYTDIVKFQKVFECLHNYTPMFPQYEKLMGYFTEIVEGLKYIVKIEKAMNYEPTVREVARLMISSIEMQSVDTVDVLAKVHNVDRDTVLNWSYSDVYKILFEDYEKAVHRNDQMLYN